MASLELLSIIGIVAVGAVMLPIVFQENPGAYLENSICTIFLGPLNFTCNQPGGNVTFTGLNGIDIFVDPAISNTTVFWNFTGSFGNGTGGNGTAVFFPLENLTNVDITNVENSNMIHFNGTTNLWENINATDYFEDSFKCGDGEFIIFNATIDNFECIGGQFFDAGVGIDNDEIFFPHLSATNADDVKVTFTNYDLRAVRFNDNVNVQATWKYVVPTNFNSTGTTMQFKLFWFTQTSDVGDVCWQLQLTKIIEGGDLDFSIPQVDEICTANLGIDIMAVDTFMIPSTVHNFTAQDLAFIQIEREAKQNDNPADTLEQNAYAIIGELRWIG